MMVLKQDHYKHWNAKTDIAMGEDRVLTISTAKDSRGTLRTWASAAKYDKGWLSHVMFQDFSVLVSESFPKRITAKVVENQHLGVDCDSIMVKALQFYKGAV